MHFNARGGVSLVELIVYLPSLIAAAFLCSRHGFGRSSGWVYTLILCLVRIIGACCQLTTYHDQSSGLIKATLIIDSIGVSPLLLATLGLLSRFVDSTNRSAQGTFGVKHFRILQLLITLGLILSIAGGSSGSIAPNGTVHISTTSKVGIVLYIIAYAGLCIISGASMLNMVYVDLNEKRIAAAVVLALPFILVRLAYSSLAVFVHNHDFNILDGSVAIFVAMAVLEEFIVVFIYLLLGFKTDVLAPDKQGPIASRPWKANRDNRGPEGQADFVALAGRSNV